MSKNVAEIDPVNSPTREAVNAVYVATINEVPNGRVGKYLGLATAVGTRSGSTAFVKGRDAFGLALFKLRSRALEMGGDAVIGLVTSPYSASHIPLFGDGVGVILTGTVVTLEPHELQA